MLGVRGGLRLCQQQGLVTTWPSGEKPRWTLRLRGLWPGRLGWGYRKSGSGEGGRHHLGCGQFEAPVSCPGETRGSFGAARVLELRAGGLGRGDRGPAVQEMHPQGPGWVFLLGRETCGPRPGESWPRLVPMNLNTSEDEGESGEWGGGLGDRHRPWTLIV